MPRVFERRSAKSEGECVWSVKTASAVRTGRSLGVAARRNQLQKSVGGIGLREAHAILSPERFVGGDGSLAKFWARRARALMQPALCEGVPAVGLLRKTSRDRTRTDSDTRRCVVSSPMEVTSDHSGNLIVTEGLNK